ncbi:class I SAM-dependent methyltransferase [Halobacteriovorax sp. HLS]|uniref:class I SAM-dependent DNA methyltransferase n=1 Tax=Halobacteriovorax sp. HLS TaxID=2234000 RepID=UPI000FD76FE7|nr:class I SAM-dependent methyltransferase [Halobacteriovorax sp. HLS]
MSHFNQAANNWDSQEKKDLMKTLAKSTIEKLSLSKKIDLLDVGCGTGLFCLEFLDYASSITGVDTSRGMLEVFDSKTKELPFVKSLELDLETKNLEEKFDLIISSMTFHHLDEPGKMLVKLAAMLKAGGKIAIVDLEEEDGSFHPRPKEMGVKHFGFSNETLKSWAQDINLNFSVCTINTKEKNGKEYNQFLAIYE